MTPKKYEDADGVVTGIKHDAVAAARSETRASGLSYLVDGYRLVSQAAEGFAHVERAFFLDPVETDRCRALMDRLQKAEAEVYRVTRGVFFRILDLGYETSVEVLAQVRRPGSADVVSQVSNDTCLMLGEQIQDPRNVGVMVRTADAWQPAATVLSADSADPWCRAAVRSSTGSIFRMPLALAEDLPAYVRRLKERGVRIVGTSAQAADPVWDADLTGPCALVLGNESVGMSEELTAECDEFVTIPMHGGAHSFNVTVAAGILLYERERQRKA